MSVRDVVYGIGKEHVGEELRILVDKGTVTFWSTRTGELVGEYPLPEHGVKDVGCVRYNRAARSEVSTMS